MIYSCKDCKDRYVGCHSVCEKYLKEKQYTEAIRLKQNEDNSIGICVNELHRGRLFSKGSEHKVGKSRRKHYANK